MRDLVGRPSARALIQHLGLRQVRRSDRERGDDEMVADALKERKFDIDTIQACVSAATRTSLLLAVGHEQSQMLEEAGPHALWRADKSNPQTTVDRQKLVRAQEAARQGVELCAKSAGSGMRVILDGAKASGLRVLWRANRSPRRPVLTARSWCGRRRGCFEFGTGQKS